MEKNRNLLIIATTPLCTDGLTAMLIRTAEVAAEQFAVAFALGEPCGPEIRARLEGIGSVYEMPSRRKSLPAYMAALRRLVRTEGFRAVYIHGNSATMAFDLLAAKRGGAAVRAAHCHNQAKQPRIKQLTLGRMMNRLVTHPAACSRRSGEALYTRPFTVIRNGIDPERFRFSPAAREKVREKLGIQDAFALGHIGRFTAQKNHARLLEIFRSVLEKRPEAVLLLCGEGELLPMIRKQAAAAGLAEKVRFCGVTEHPEEFLSAMDVLVMPSLFEGLPLVGVEAQASGLPCVFADTITPEADVTGTVSFLSLEKGDGEWADAVCAAAGRESAPDRASAADRVRAAGYDTETAAEQIRTLVSGFLG